MDIMSIDALSKQRGLELPDDWLVIKTETQVMVLDVSTGLYIYVGIAGTNDDTALQTALDSVTSAKSRIGLRGDFAPITTPVISKSFTRVHGGTISVASDIPALKIGFQGSTISYLHVDDIKLYRNIASPTAYVCDVLDIGVLFMRGVHIEDGITVGAHALRVQGTVPANAFWFRMSDSMVVGQTYMQNITDNRFINVLFNGAYGTDFCVGLNVAPLTSFICCHFIMVSGTGYVPGVSVVSSGAVTFAGDCNFDGWDGTHPFGPMLYLNASNSCKVIGSHFINGWRTGVTINNCVACLVVASTFDSMNHENSYNDDIRIQGSSSTGNTVQGTTHIQTVSHANAGAMVREHTENGNPSYTSVIYPNGGARANYLGADGIELIPGTGSFKKTS